VPRVADMATLLLATTTLAALAPPLSRALKQKQALIVDVVDEGPVEALDLEDFSEMARDAGAAALLLPPSLLPAVAAEQRGAAGNFPGPVPLIARADANADLAALKSAGACAVALPEEALAADVAAAAAAEGLEVLAWARGGDAYAAAAAAGVAAVVCDADAAAAAADDGVAVLGDWEGDADELDALREAGFGPLLLRDGCDGSVGDGRYRCEALIKASKSKRSKLLSGSMFGVSENDGPEKRNPRMWAQSKRQAKEIMHESAASRGLPPPKLKK